MVSPAKMKALVDKHAAAGPSAAALGMAPQPMAPDDMGDDEDPDAEPAEPVDPVSRGNELIEEWGEFGTALKESADLIHDNAHDVGAELLLKEVPKDAVKAVGKAVDRMPDDIQMGLAKYVSALSPEDCDALAKALVASMPAEDQADENLMCAFLKAAGAYAKDEVDVDEDFNVPEESDEEDKDEGGDAADKPAEGAAPAEPGGDHPPA